MTKQLLFYEQAVPVSAQRHANWSLDARRDYGFAAQTNSVPLTVAEFAAAAAEYAIVFAGGDATLRPVVVLGFKNDQNLYLDDRQRWNARYVPAFVRRYPFVFSQTDAADQLVLCIDETYPAWNQDGRGRRLFDVNGDRSEFLQQMVEFVENYQRQSAQTEAFCRRLEQFGLLAPVAARFKLPTGEPARITGFKAVDRDRLKALSGERFVELAKSNELELIYLHLQSLRSFDNLLSRVGDDLPAADAAGAAAEPTG